MRLLLPLAVLLAGCGQTGPLVLPEQAMAPLPAPPVVVTPPAQDEAEDDDTRAEQAPEAP